MNIDPELNSGWHYSFAKLPRKQYSFPKRFTDPNHRKHIEITRPVFGEIFAGAIAKRFILLYEYDYIELHVLVFYGYNWR